MKKTILLATMFLTVGTACTFALLQPYDGNTRQQQQQWYDPGGWLDDNEPLNYNNDYYMREDPYGYDQDYDDDTFEDNEDLYFDDDSAENLYFDDENDRAYDFNEQTYDDPYDTYDEDLYDEGDYEGDSGVYWRDPDLRDRDAYQGMDQDDDLYNDNYDPDIYPTPDINAYDYEYGYDYYSEDWDRYDDTFETW